MMRKLYFVILVSTILLSACAEPTPEIPPTFTPKPTSCSELEGSCFKLTFDGESCTYEGQEEM
ncbi:MAG: hypothetical protein KAR43_12215, partial [Deltaproteobacteria bacterium]|nr:hypothetical protein [Deltaproteobacteria bacterium]